MDFEQTKAAFETFQTLTKMAKRLRTLDVAYCAGDLSTKQWNERRNLENRAMLLALSLGLKSVHQADPRGRTLILVDPSMEAVEGLQAGIEV